MSESTNPNSVPPGEFLPDPTTDHPHTTQTKSGAIAGAVVGTTVGTIVAGPLGAAIGVVAGGIVGALAGKVGGEMFDPSSEAEYWVANHASQTFVRPEYEFADYELAYRTGYSNYVPGETFEKAEPDLKRFYDENGGALRMTWTEARPAALAAWQHMEYIFPIEAYNRT